MNQTLSLFFIMKRSLFSKMKNLVKHRDNSNLKNIKEESHIVKKRNHKENIKEEEIFPDKKKNDKVKENTRKEMTERYLKKIISKNSDLSLFPVSFISCK
jgi:hypothetical protein